MDRESEAGKKSQQLEKSLLISSLLGESNDEASETQPFSRSHIKYVAGL